MKRLLLLALVLGLTGSAFSRADDRPAEKADKPSAEAKDTPPDHRLYSGRLLRAWLEDLKDDDQLIKEEAIEVLAQIGPPARAAVGPLNRMLKGENRTLRIRAALALWKIAGESKAAVTVLSGSLRGAGLTARRDALTALGEMGALAAPAAPTIVDLTSDPDQNIRNLATNTLSRIGTAATPALLKSLGDKALSRRRNAIDLLTGSLSSLLTRAAVPALTARLKDTDKHLRIHSGRALWSLGEHGKPVLAALLEGVRAGDDGTCSSIFTTLTNSAHKPKTLVGLLEVGIKNPNLSTRISAARLLREVEGKAARVIPIYTEALKPANRTYWTAAIEAIKEAGPEAKSLIGRLIEILKDRTFYSGHSIREALVHIGEPAIPSLVRLLKESTPPGFGTWNSPQEAAVYCLGQLGAKAATAVTGVLKETDASVRVRACRVLGAIGPAAKGAALKLADLVKDKDATIREAAATALGNIGPEAKAAIPNLLNLAKGSDLSLRIVSMRALVQIGPDAKTIVPICALALKEKNNNLRLSALELLWRADPKHKDLLPNVQELIKDASTRGSALGLLGRMGPAAEKAVPAVVELLKDTNEYVRRQAADALGSIGPPAKAAVPNLLTLLKEPTTWTQASALTAIKNIGGDPKKVVPALVTFLKTSRAYPATTAVNILEEYGPKAADAVPVLAGLFKDSRATFLYGPAAEALFKINPARAKKEAVPVLRTRLKAEPANLAYARALAFIDPTDKEAVKVLGEGLKNTNYYTRWQAAQAIGMLGPKGKTFTADIKALLKDASPYVRAVAAVALWRITKKADDALTPLLALLKDANSYTRSFAAGQLAEMGAAAKKAVPALRTAYTSADTNVRTAIGAALKKIDPDAAVKAGVP
jgi:HEAT repeat protein